MIYTYKKYNDIKDFVNNYPKSDDNISYTIAKGCPGIDFNRQTITADCFACLFCILENEKLRKNFLHIRGNDYFSKISKESFNGKPISAPKVITDLRKHPYDSLKSFTSTNETSNIQPWAAGLLGKMSSNNSRVSMEIPVFNTDYPRNGRLDIGVMVNNRLLVVESKTSLDDALKDERFLEQQVKYTNEIDKITSDYLYLTLFGGEEKDLFPPNSRYCSGKIGGKSQRFYEMAVDNNIKFVTANALWCLCCRYLEVGSEYCWDSILKKIFNDAECIGIISAGKVLNNNSDYRIVPF